ncbi:MAG: copper uptake system-associated protein [Methylophilaceae bacterium]
MMFNKKSLLTIIYGLITLLIFSLVCAVAEGKETAAIETALKAQWDKPNQPIRIPVIVVHGDYAIADWIQEPRGGRALLFYNNSVWQTIFCGDVNMKQVSNLISAGVPHNDAKKLAAALDEKEKRLTDADKALIDSFKGIVDLLKEPQHHAH